MRRKKPLLRGAPPRRVNRERAAKRKARDFGEYADWIRAQPCVVGLNYQHRARLHFLPSGQLVRLSDAAHVKSRGAGGRAEHLAPLCALHHAEQHALGIKSFQKRYGVQLGAIAADLWGRYQAERGAA